jgi:hypothetical protein
MTNSKIEPHKINKPFQLLAVWMIGLILMTGTLITGAGVVNTPTWVPPMLCVSTVMIIVVGIILPLVMFIKYRKEFLDDPYYIRVKQIEHKEYEKQFKEFLINTARGIEKVEQKDGKTSNNQIQAELTAEKETRRVLVKKHIQENRLGMLPILTFSGVCGRYFIVGYNPNTPDESYYGYLTVHEEGEVLLGKWDIGSTHQGHEGIGVLAGNSLAFHFKYTNPKNQKEEHGVVLYQFISEDLMRGHWTGFGTFNLGFEECRKMDEKK